MNTGYKQASLEDKKHDVAGKMPYPMHGNKAGFSHKKHQRYTMSVHSRDGMKYSETGHKVKMHGGKGEIASEEGSRPFEGTKGQKFPMANKKGRFMSSQIPYTQHGDRPQHLNG